MAMHLASMVHSSGRERNAFHHHHHHHQQQHSYFPPQTQARGYAVPVSMAPGPFTSHPQAPVVEYHYQHQQQRHPQSPPSPPVEEQKPSLPSISSLLGIADGDKPASESATQSPQSQPSQQSSPQLRQEPQRVSAGAVQQQPTQAQSRPEQQAPVCGPSIVSHPRMTLPPTPPMHPDPAIDGNQSPSAASNHSAASAPYFLGQSLNNVEPHLQRQNGPSVPSMKRDSLPSQPSMSPYSASTYAQSPYASSPGAASATSFYSPETHAYNGLGMYAQRSLPSNFQPQMPLPIPTTTANASGVWQHHHYISTSSQSAFPQSQDRYICSTCNKAFSRPSSLRIHSHSHTGEKPYKCPQPNCGKAFSVRSNMKRHERGCHASTSATLST